MGYKSRVNIRIGQRAPVTDDELFPVFQEIYNALHILNANVDQTVDILIPPESDTAPSQSFSARIRQFWAPAADNVTQGRICRMSGAEFIRGATGVTYTTPSGTRRITDPFGFCAEDSTDGKAMIAWPPFILQADTGDDNTGKTLYASQTGELTLLPPGEGLESNQWPVGIVVDDDYILLIPNMHT